MINKKYEKNLFYHFQSKICRYKIGKQKEKDKESIFDGIMKNIIYIFKNRIL